MTLGEKLQRLRAGEGLTQEALAELLGVSRQAVSKWERDEAVPETDKVVRLSDRFQVSTDYLLKDAPPPQPSPRRRTFGAWFRDRGWLLGLVPACWGLYRMAGLLPLALAGPRSWWHLCYAALQYPLVYAPPALAGLLAAALGRRLSGRLAWYHAGAPAVLWSLLEAARFLLYALLLRFPPPGLYLVPPPGPPLAGTLPWLLCLSGIALAGALVLLLGRRAAGTR